MVWCWIVVVCDKCDELTLVSFMQDSDGNVITKEEKQQEVLFAVRDRFKLRLAQGIKSRNQVHTQVS